MVAGELTTDSLRFVDRSSGGSSRGLLDADVATANAAAAVDVLLLYYSLVSANTDFEKFNIERNRKILNRLRIKRRPI